MRCGNATCMRRSTRYTVRVGKAAIPPVTELQAVPLDAVVDLVNEWSTVARRTAQEQDRSFPEFPHFAAAHGLDTNEFGRQLDNDDLVRVADSLYPAFSVPGDDEAAAHLNSLLAEAKPTPRLAPSRSTTPAYFRLICSAWGFQRRTSGPGQARTSPSKSR